MSATYALKCNEQCARFMAEATGGRGYEHQLEPPLSRARVVFIACNGVKLGGAQLRCVETARLMSSHGVPSICIDGRFRNSTDAGRGCTEKFLQPLAGRKFRAIVFCKSLPSEALLRSIVRPATQTLLLDSMDLDPGYHASACRTPSVISLFDGYITNNNLSMTILKQKCPQLSNVNMSMIQIEHFHSVTRRVAYGKPELRRALLVQEHRVYDIPGWCGKIQQSLPRRTRFDCRPLWGGAASIQNRFEFLRKENQLSVPLATVIGSQYLGVGAMFTSIYQRYDLLIQCWATTGSVQRLTNALATGVPVIALTCPAFEEAFGWHPDVLLVANHEELRQMASKLNASAAFRMRVSNAGVEAANAFSRERIATQYINAFGALGRRSRGLAALRPRHELHHGSTPKHPLALG